MKKRAQFIVLSIILCLFMVICVGIKFGYHSLSDVIYTIAGLIVVTVVFYIGCRVLER